MRPDTSDPATEPGVPTVQLTLRLPADVHRDLQAVAAEQRRSLNTAVVVAVERFVRQTRARQPKEDGLGRSGGA